MDGKLLRRIEKSSAHISIFFRQFLPSCAHMFHPASLVIHPEHAEYFRPVGCNYEGGRADRIPNGTYIKDVNKGDK